MAVKASFRSSLVIIAATYRRQAPAKKKFRTFSKGVRPE
jgi:hypothetical protein